MERLGWMKRVKDRLGRVFSIDWSKRVPNLIGFLCASVVYIAWSLLPIPEVHFIVFNVDLIGALPAIAACVASAVFMLRRDGRKAAGSLVNYITYALLLATVLIFLSILLDIPLIVVPGGVNLDIVMLFVALVAFLGLAGARGFWAVLFELFFLVGIPLLLVDIYFGFAIHVTLRIPFGSLILGGGGLSDGLNKMFFVILTFAIVYHLLSSRYGAEMEVLGAKYLGSQGGKEEGGTAPAAP